MTTAMVTGSSGGIGLATAKLLAAEGYELTLVARNLDRLNEIAASLPGENHRVVQADLSQAADIARLAEQVSEGGFDLLINNAGVGLEGRFDELPLEQQLAMMTLNMTALVTLSHAFLGKAKRGDALVNVASVLGISSYPGMSAYVGTKGFAVKFSESLWHENKQRGVYVTAFCPGVTATPFHEASGGDWSTFPKMMVQAPNQVAQELVAALKGRAKPSAISGFINKSMLFSLRLMPRRAAVNIMGLLSPLKDDG